MARDISIAISAKDNFTDAITKMKSAQTGFRKDMGQLNVELNKMNNTKVNLKVDMMQAKNELRDAEKAFRKVGDEVSRNNLKMAQADYDNVKRNFDLVSKSAKQTEKDIKNLTDTVSKSENAIDKVNGPNQDKSITGVTASQSMMGGASSLAKAGLGNMIGSSVASFMGAGITSFAGDSVGNAIASIAGGAVSGAAIGSIIPGIGTAVGAAVGTVAGGINAAVQSFEREDDAFKAVVQSNYELTQQMQQQSLSNGSTISGSREQTQIAFGTLLGGEDKAKAFLKEITGFSTTTPFQFDQLTAISKTMLAYGYKQNEIVEQLTKVGDAGSALGHSADDMNVVQTMLGRMKSSGKANLEYLNPLLERGIPVWDYLAQSTGKTNAQVQEMVSKGLIPGAQAAQDISDAMGKMYAGNMQKQSESFDGMMSTLTDLKSQVDAAMGEGYNEERKKGMQAEIDYLSGESGRKLQEAMRMIGEHKAYLENQKEEAIREALSGKDGVMNTTEYINAERNEDRLKMGELLAAAQIKGENAYLATDGYQEKLQSERDLIGRIRQDTSLKEEHYNTGYIFMKEFSKGRKAAAAESYSDFAPPTLIEPGTGILPTVTPAPKYAYGLSYVPYDNYPALLHQGERIMTASQARSADASQPIQVTINGLSVREEADTHKIAIELFKEIQKASVNVA